MKNFPLGVFDNEDYWIEIYGNSELKELIQEIIENQYYPSLIISFLWGLNKYDKEDVAGVIDQIKDNQYCGKILKQDFREVLKKDSVIDAYFKEKLLKKYYQDGKNSAITKFKKINIGVIISLIVIILILFIPLMLKLF